MPLRRMPNGEVIEIADGTPPDVIARIEQQYKPTRVQRRAAEATGDSGTAPKSSARRTAEALQRTSAAYGGRDKVISGLTWNFDDEILGGAMAATMGTWNAIKKGDLKEIGRVYREARDTRNEQARIYTQENPVTATAAEIGGAVFNPVGTGARGVKAVADVAKAVGKRGTAARALRTSRRMERAGPIATGVTAGGVHGAMASAGASENLSDIPTDMLYGGAVSALMGGTLGAGVHGIRRGAQIVSDMRPGNADRTAYSRIDELIRNSDESVNTPGKLRREIETTDRAGGDAMVMDMSPGLRAQAGHISRKPSVPSSNAMVERGEARIGGRLDRFAQQAEARASTGRRDARDEIDSIVGRRKAAGKQSYGEGGSLDTQLTWTDDLDKFFKGAPDADRLIQRAYTNAQRFGDDLGKIDPEGQAIPSMRVFDYLKREFDREIKMAYRAGDDTTAAGYGAQLRRLKELISDANPQYKQVLAQQRDEFQKQQAVELGQLVFNKMGRQPREMFRDLKALPKEVQDEARIGIIDQLVNSTTKADPVSDMRRLMRNDAQRKIFEFAFGGKKNFDSFQKWVEREWRSRNADLLTAPGRQSETSRMQLASDEGDGGVGSLMMNTAKGYAFGGPMGGVSNAVRTISDIAHGVNRFSQEKMAQILMSKGEDLEKGIKEVAEYMAKRAERNKAVTKWMGKAAQQPFSSEIGGE